MSLPEKKRNQGREEIGEDPKDRMIDGLIEKTAASSPRRPEKTLRLASGRSITADRAGDEDLIEVTSPDGKIELSVRLTPEGPVLSMDAARLKLKAKQDVRVECEDFHVEAARDAQIRSERETRLESGTLDVKTTKGDAKVKAKIDLRLRGERIFLN